MNSQVQIDHSTDMESIADELMTLARSIRANHPTSVGSGEPTSSQADDAPHTDDTPLSRRKLLALAEKAYADRRKREQIIGSADLFGEPAWDILLHLFIAFLKENEVSVSSACIGSAAPPTTGLRWLGVLEDNALVVREKDLADQRRILVRISEDGIARMSEYFRSVERAPN
ncbi:MAG: MarR family transcriptional regulator [Erythrobacter sp.]